MATANRAVPVAVMASESPMKASTMVPSAINSSVAAPLHLAAACASGDVLASMDSDPALRRADIKRPRSGTTLGSGFRRGIKGPTAGTNVPVRSGTV